MPPGSPPPEIQKLRDEVAKVTTVTASAKTLINSQAQRLRDMADNATDFADLQLAVNNEADNLDSAANDLAAAVTAGTSTPPGS